MPVDRYGYPVTGSIGVRPGSVAYGGLSFDITPGDAEVFVDGTYVGVVDDFGPTEDPLSLTAGVHHIELRDPGFRPFTFDVSVVPGQVIPYSGALGR